jgi:hypothetical protein
VPHTHTLISPNRENLTATLLESGGSVFMDYVLFGETPGKYMLFREHRFPAEEMLSEYSETHPGYTLDNARFFYVEYNDIHQLVHLRSILSKHTNVLVDAGPELLLPLQIWLEAREAGRLL